tara:strand:- start:471 stop:683 length:213 start_codon:yes stop_codon:yes gene_type:complete
MGKKLEYPEQLTYYICWDDSRSELKTYGSVNTNQVLTSPWNVVDFYTDMSQWRTILVNNGIDASEIDNYY